MKPEGGIPRSWARVGRSVPEGGQDGRVRPRYLQDRLCCRDSHRLLEAIESITPDALEKQYSRKINQ